tara:strand:+ start:226 stop:453 length:228 start_codon:yes stop_codon:yes gene_type:complete
MRGAKMRDFKTIYNSALAQLVEQMTVNHWVAGSSPASGANIEDTKVCALVSNKKTDLESVFLCLKFNLSRGLAHV